jgi:hypothetical protein
VPSPQDQQLVEASRALRGHLHELDINDPERLDATLSDLLARAGDQDIDVGEELRVAVASDPASREWVDLFMTRGVGAALARLPGDPPRVPGARRYRCPEGDFDWYQRSRDQTPPVCPTHQLALVPA